MTRRPKVGGKPIKGRLPNAQKPRRSKMAKAAPRSMSFSSRDQAEVTRLMCELNTAIERQNATAEILASVSRSSTDTRPVFDAILDNLLRLFRTRFALVLLVRNGMFEVGGIKGDLSFDELAKHYPLLRGYFLERLFSLDAQCSFHRLSAMLKPRPIHREWRLNLVSTPRFQFR